MVKTSFLLGLKSLKQWFLQPGSKSERVPKVFISWTPAFSSELPSKLLTRLPFISKSIAVSGLLRIHLLLENDHLFFVP